MSTTSWEQQSGMASDDETVGPVTYPNPPTENSTPWSQRAGMPTPADADLGAVEGFAVAAQQYASDAAISEVNAASSAVAAEESYQNTVNHTFTTTNISDIDNTNRSDGSVLVYNGTTSKYVATNAIENDNIVIKGGNY